MRRNERASERRQTLERLTEVETHGSILRRPEDRDVRVGRDFKTGKTAVLVATDVAARGLDIPAVSLVIKYVMIQRCWRLLINPSAILSL